MTKARDSGESRASQIQQAEARAPSPRPANGVDPPPAARRCVVTTAAPALRPLQRQPSALSPSQPQPGAASSPIGQIRHEYVRTAAPATARRAAWCRPGQPHGAGLVIVLERRHRHLKPEGDTLALPPHRNQLAAVFEPLALEPGLQKQLVRPDVLPSTIRGGTASSHRRPSKPARASIHGQPTTNEPMPMTKPHHRRGTFAGRRRRPRRSRCPTATKAAGTRLRITPRFRRRLPGPRRSCRLCARGRPPWRTRS